MYMYMYSHALKSFRTEILELDSRRTPLNEDLFYMWEYWLYNIGSRKFAHDLN